jgi:hypothetical protein
MEVNNRFDLLLFLSGDEESVVSFCIDVPSSEQKLNIDDGQSTTNCWDIPQYVEKIIPCSTVINTIVETSPPVTKAKTSVHVKKVKSPDKVTKCEEQGERETSVTVEVQDQPTTYSYYPPQPYKFKQNSSSECTSVHNRLFQLQFSH